MGSRKLRENVRMGVSEQKDAPLECPTGASEQKDASLECPTGVSEQKDASLECPTGVSEQKDAPLECPTGVSERKALFKWFPAGAIFLKGLLSDYPTWAPPRLRLSKWSPTGAPSCWRLLSDGRVGAYCIRPLLRVARPEGMYQHSPPLGRLVGVCFCALLGYTFMTRVSQRQRLSKWSPTGAPQRRWLLSENLACASLSFWRVSNGALPLIPHLLFFP